MGILLVPETYAPFLLAQRARALSKITGKVHKSKLDINSSASSSQAIIQRAIVRPLGHPTI